MPRVVMREEVLPTPKLATKRIALVQLESLVDEAHPKQVLLATSFYWVLLGDKEQAWC